MVRIAKEEGVKPAARLFGTTVKTVRKWLARWIPGTLQGLQEKSRAPHNPVQRISDEQRKQLLELKKQLPSWGAERIKRDYQLSVSEKAIRKIWRQEGLLRRKRRKHRTWKAREALKSAKIEFSTVDVVVVELPHVSGALGQVARKLADAGINIDYAYACGAGSEALGVLKVSDAARANRLLPQ